MTDYGIKAKTIQLSTDPAKQAAFARQRRLDRLVVWIKARLGFRFR